MSSSEDSDNELFPLAEVIEELRKELLDAVQKGSDSALRFKLKPVELECQVSVKREIGGDGGLRFWIVNLGAKAGRSDIATHTLKLSLEPVYQDGEADLLVSGTGSRD